MVSHHVVHAGALLLGVASVSHGMKRYAVVLAALLCATAVTFTIITRLADAVFTASSACTRLKPSVTISPSGK
jgi:preprotein translocase subunit SecG